MVPNGYVLFSIELRFYETTCGKSPIEKFLLSLPAADRATITAVLSKLEAHKFEVKVAVFRQLAGKLWEII